jgi:hypothetical protein
MKFLQRFFSSDISGGIVLIIAAVLAMVGNLGDQRVIMLSGNARCVQGWGAGNQ